MRATKMRVVRGAGPPPRGSAYLAWAEYNRNHTQAPQGPAGAEGAVAVARCMTWGTILLHARTSDKWALGCTS